MEPILAKNEDIAAKNTAYVSLRCILNDTSKENVERILNALIKWHTKPFLCEGLLGTDCKAGLNTTYIYRCLDNLYYGQHLACLLCGPTVSLPADGPHQRGDAGVCGDVFVSSNYT